MFFQTEGYGEATYYVIGIAILAAVILLCCSLQCCLYRKIRKKRQYEEHFEPLHYPSSTLQFVRFSHNRREPRMGSTRRDIPFDDQK